MQSTHLPMTPGIYMIVNHHTHHVYVGSTLYLRKRCLDHSRNLRNGKHKNVHLQNAYNRYSHDNFFFYVLEHVTDTSYLLEREQYFIDLMKPEYNIALFADSPTRGLKLLPPSPETRAKLRAAKLGKKRSPETIAKISATKRNKTLSPETRAKLGAVHLGKKVSLETRAKLSAAHMGRKLSPEHAAKVRVANLGRKHTPEARANMNASRFGKKCSPETKAKIGAANRGRKRSPEHNAKLRAANLGKKRSPESIAKQRAVMLEKKLRKLMQQPALL